MFLPHRTLAVKKIAMVTGEGSDRRRAVVVALAEAGYDLVLQHHGEAVWAWETARQVELAGRRALVVEADPADDAALLRAVEAVRDAYGRLDVLVNGAARWEEGFRAPFLAMKAAAPLLYASGGAVVNVLEEPSGDPASRAALQHLTRGMSRILSPNVRVNAVAPGAGETSPGEAGSRHLVGGGAGVPAWEAEVVRAILFLLGSPHHNGEVVSVGGGLRQA